MFPSLAAEDNRRRWSISFSSCGSSTRKTFVFPACQESPFAASTVAVVAAVLLSMTSMFALPLLAIDFELTLDQPLSMD